MMTINNFNDLFSNIATAHKQINDYGFGEEWEIEEKMNKEVKYPLFYVIPTGSTTLLQTKRRRFRLVICDMVNKDKSNIVEVWSDTEQMMDDLIKILRLESDEYELVNEPVLLPFKEVYSDWSAGYECEVEIETQFNNNYCDIPSSTFVSPETQALTTVTVLDQNGNVLATKSGGQSYVVTVLTGINDTLVANVTTIVDNIT